MIPLNSSIVKKKKKGIMRDLNHADAENEMGR